MTEKKMLVKYIKTLHPVGSEIYVTSAYNPFIVRKDSVFEAHVWKYDDYNDEMRPHDRENYVIDFLVHNPGNDTRRYHLAGSTLRWVREFDERQAVIKKHEDVVIKKDVELLSAKIRNKLSPYWNLVALIEDFSTEKDPLKKGMIAGFMVKESRNLKKGQDILLELVDKIDR